MGKGPFIPPRATLIRGIGCRVCNMEVERKRGLMGQASRGPIHGVKKKEKACFSGQIKMFIMVDLKIT
jgi:hypothetical protein